MLELHFLRVKMEIESYLIILAMIISPIYAIQLYILKKLNFTCGIVSKLAVLSRLAHPELAKTVFGNDESQN